MNICMMTNTYLPHVGGVARSVDTFSNEYKKRGHAVLIVSPKFSLNNGHNGKSPQERHVVRLPAIQNFNGSDFSVRLPLTAIFNPVLNEFPANVVHSHHPFLLGDTALRIAAEKHAAMIFTHHTLYEQYTHYVPFDSPRLKQFIIDLGTRYANMCDGLIAPSESIASLVSERGVKVPIEIIPTGIDLEKFSGGNRERFRQAHGIPPRAFVVGHVGRLAPEKNLAFVARSAARFLKQHPRSFFLVVGDGPDAKTIQSIFSWEGLSDLLVMPGQLTGSSLADAYAAMNVFAFASQSETQGMVLAEAMAAGVPVVALDGPGVREIVRHEENGALLPAGARESEFADWLHRFRTDTPFRRRCKDRARRTARKFSKEACADRALAFYDFIRGKTRPQRRQLARDPLAALLYKIRVEWDILSQKAQTAIQTFRSEPEESAS